MTKAITNLGKVLLTPRGEYEEAREYERLDVITYRGSSFLVLTPFQGEEPSSENQHVMLLSSKGDKGDAFTYEDLTDEQKAELKGEKGDTGKGFVILGYCETLLDLEALVPDPAPGDAYGVGTEAPYTVFVYDSLSDSWVDNGQLQGVKGEDGSDGADGKNAYEFFLEGGGCLSEEEFTDSLIRISGKVDKEEGAGLYPDADKEKLSGIEEGANKCVHPDDEDARHVTDVQIAGWDSKAPGDHHHDEVYQPKGSYADADHDHADLYQPKGNYQAAGSYAASDHNHDSVYQPKGSYAASSHTHDGVYVKPESGKGLSTNDFTAAYKSRLDSAVITTDHHEVTTLTGLPVTKYSIKCTYSSSTPTAISFSSTPAEGFECIISIKNNTSANITQAIPNGTGWQSDEVSVDLEAGKVSEFSVRYVFGTYIMKVIG